MRSAWYVYVMLKVSEWHQNTNSVRAFLTDKIGMATSETEWMLTKSFRLEPRDQEVPVNQRQAYLPLMVSIGSFSHTLRGRDSYRVIVSIFRLTGMLL
jgi:hypothetical protein